MHSLRMARLKRFWPGAFLVLGVVLLAVLARRSNVLPWFETLLFLFLAVGIVWFWYRNRQYREILTWATACLREQRCASVMPASTLSHTAVRQFRAALRNLLYGHLAGQTRSDNIFLLPERQVRLLTETVVDIQQDLELQQAMLESLERCLDSKTGIGEALGEEVDLSLHSMLAILEELASQTDRIALNAAIEAAGSDESERSENIVTVTRETGSLAWKIRQYVGEIREAVKTQEIDSVCEIPPESQETTGQAQALLRQLLEISRQSEIRLDRLRRACSGPA